MKNKKTIFLFAFFLFLFFFSACSIVFSCTEDAECEYGISCNGDNIMETPYTCVDGTCTAGTTTILEEGANHNYEFCDGDAVWEKLHTCSDDAEGVCIVPYDEVLIDTCSGYCTEEGETAYCVNTPSVETNEATTIQTNQATLEGSLTDIGENIESADVYFQWGTPGSLLNTTSPETKNSPSSFSSTISGLDPGTTYEFRAVAENIAGTVYGETLSFITLEEAGPAGPEVQTNEATNLGETQADLEGALLGFGDFSDADVYFKWGLPGNLSNTTSLQNKTLTGSFSQTIGGLYSGTTYEFRAVATNEGGTDYGSILSFTTLGDSTPFEPEVQTNEATNVMADTANLEGSLTDIGENIESADVYFQWGTPGNLSNTTSLQTKISASSFISGISGLSAETTYEFRAVAENEVGTVYGETLSLTTLSVSAPAGPEVQTNEGTNLGETQADLEGALLGFGDFSDADVYFKWGLPGNLSNTTSLQNMISTGEFNETVLGLSAETTYEFRAVAENEGGVFHGDILSFTTLIDLTPSEPEVQTNEATNIELNQVTLEGSLINIGNNVESADVYFQWGTPGNLSNTTSLQTKISASSFTSTISGLSAETTYEFRAVAENEVGTVYGETLSFTTLSISALSGPKVQTNEATSIGTDEAKLRGTLLDFGDFPDADVYFKWGTPGNLSNFTTLQTLILTGIFEGTVSQLSPGTTYEFRAVAENEGGESHGTIISFTTFEALEINELSVSYQGKRKKIKVGEEGTIETFEY